MLLIVVKLTRLLFYCRLLPLIAGALLLSGCPSQPVETETPTAAYTTNEALIQLAAAEKAAARKQASPAREEHLMNAAEAYLEAKAYRQAQDVLDKINTALLPIPQLGRHRLLYCRLALAEDSFFLARKMLTDERLELRAGQLPPGLQKAWHRQRAELFALLGEEAASVAEYQALAQRLDNPDAIADTHEHLWQVLNHIPEQVLPGLANNTLDKELRGWYQLAIALRKSSGDIQQQVRQLADWRASHPHHPATRIPPTSLSRVEATGAALPGQLALLLPESGDFAPAARTIRDGLLAALYQAQSQGMKTPQIQIYNSLGADIATLYNQAVAQGADVVIGPLQKEHIEQLSRQPALPVPTIALNYVENTHPVPGNLYQFGLSITDEARQVANRAWIEGQRTALCIAPDTGWGQSARAAFEQAWLNKGGALINMAPYPTNQQDFAPLLKPQLLLDQSQERASRLERTLGKNLQFTPRRRQDLDMIFLVSYPDKGRQIKPTLDFLYAGDLRIYATSHIYSGAPNPKHDRDLEGIRFSAMPWFLPGNTSDLLKPVQNLPSAYRNLFALGLDTYQLQQWLHLMQALPNTRLPGHTGNLYLGARNQVQRTHPWAEFHGGRVQAAPQLSE